MLTKRWNSLVAIAAATAIAGVASARPVVYTLTTVSDGRLGSYTFSQAIVTIRMQGDTSTQTSRPGPLGGRIVENRWGRATLSITEHGHTTTAQFAPGEVYVRYDTGNGIAGFGSPISPTYPVALGCDNQPFPDAVTYVQNGSDCLQGDWGPVGGDSFPSATGSYNASINGTLNGMAEAQYRGTPGDIDFTLPPDLSHSSLLTATAHACATLYGVSAPNSLLNCSGPAPRGLHTDHGGFFLEDLYGVYDSQYSNSGYLQVEVGTNDD